MQSSDRELVRIQAWMQSVIMNPLGVMDGIACAASRAHIDVSPDEIETVIARSTHQTSIERLGIYSSAYYARLLECLRAEFPIMTQAMGAELFDEFAVQYLQQYPPHSYTLNALGASFATFLAQTRPPSGDEDNSWLDFLVDLARLEWCFSEVFDGPGAERQRLLAPDQLQAISPEAWPAARLVATPGLRILSLEFPVHGYYQSIRDGRDVAPPDREPTWLAVSRRNYVVRHRAMTLPEATILAAVLNGATIGDSIAQCVIPAECESFADDLQRWFQEWTAEGFFLAVAAI
jgi:hypothetical protein